jgi:hypothetical protein
MKIRPSYAYFLSLNDNVFTALEVGVREGFNAYQLLNTTDRLEELTLVDNYAGEFEKFENVMRETLKPFWNRCVFHKTDSISASNLIKDNSIDYIYIDGDHSEQAVLADIEAWYPKVKDGGVLAGHDWWKLDVKKSVIAFAQKYQCRLFACSPMFSTTVLSQNEGEFMDWWFVK